MSKYVLFSPIGGSDPVRGDYDGPMLHIVRHYKPEKVYLYYTKEMAEKKNKVNAALKPFAVKIEEYITDIENPQDFDIFATTFGEITTEIQEKNPEKEILVNISSGTPQIKSALCLEVVSSAVKLKAIQVESPVKGSSENVMHGGKIENNVDNIMKEGEYELPNRCSEPNILSFRRASIKRDIESLIEYHEYRAALEKLEENIHLFTNEAMELVAYANLRQHDNSMYRKSDWDSTFTNMQDSRAITACNYYCILANNAKSGELSYFILLLKPLAEHIAHDFIEKHIGVFPSEEQASKVLNNRYRKEGRGKFYPTYVAKSASSKRHITYNLEQYIWLMEHHKLPLDEIEKFRAILDKIDIRRNLLAHDLYREKDIDPHKVLRTLKDIIHRTYGNKVNHTGFTLYEDINKKILEFL